MLIEETHVDVATQAGGNMRTNNSSPAIVPLTNTRRHIHLSPQDRRISKSKVSRRSCLQRDLSRFAIILFMFTVTIILLNIFISSPVLYLRFLQNTRVYSYISLHHLRLPGAD